MNPAGTRISTLTKQLAMDWQQAREYWTDAKALEFDAKYMQELFSSIDRTLTVIEQLDKLIGKIKKDCE